MAEIVSEPDRTRTDLNPVQIALLLGFLSLLLILAVLGFQYIGGYPPCEMCQWQRWPHFASIVFGLAGGGLVAGGMLERRLGRLFAWLAVLCVAISGAIAVYHAGVEWKFWAGPSACTGPRFVFTGNLDLSQHIVRCDAAAVRYFGISLAGYNAIVSLGAACFASILLLRRR